MVPSSTTTELELFGGSVELDTGNAAELLDGASSLEELGISRELLDRSGRVSLLTGTASDEDWSRLAWAIESSTC
jgi:hypothetical protein